MVESGTVSTNQNLRTELIVPMTSLAVKVASANSNAKDAKVTHFFDLPLKLRQKIYTLVFGSRRYLLFAGTYHSTLTSTGKPHMLMHPAIPGLLCSRLKIKREALEIFYAVNQFTINGLLDKQLFSTINGQVARKHMVDVTFEEFFYPMPVRRCYYRVVARVEDGDLQVHPELALALFCTCDMKIAVRNGATRKVESGDGQRGLAYAAIEYFCDEYMPSIQDKIVQGITHSLRCDDCQVLDSEEEESEG
ncbi:hypothetical protein LTR17_017031 [Elasticomyces elasticus]|nr:hypothetical protein LTR17_017031 [Elasticomyces elasticus]